MSQPLASLDDGRSPWVILVELLSLREAQCREMIMDERLHKGMIIRLYTRHVGYPTFY